MRIFKNKKGVFGLDDFLALTLISTLIILIPFFVLKYHINNVLQIENKENTASLALLALISLKYNGNVMPMVLGEHFVYNNPSDLSFLSKYLDDFVPNKCYLMQTPEISSTTTTASGSSTQLSLPSYSLDISPVIPEGSCTLDTTASINIVLPYNPQQLVQKLELSVGD